MKASLWVLAAAIVFVAVILSTRWLEPEFGLPGADRSIRSEEPQSADEDLDDPDRSGNRTESEVSSDAILFSSDTRIHGVVESEEGLPLEGAEVTLQISDTAVLLIHDILADPRVLTLARDVSDAEGRFSFQAPFASGALVIRASREGLVTATLAHVIPGVRHVLVCTRAASLRGFVTVKGSAEGCAGARLMGFSTASGLLWEVLAETDSAGGFVIGGLSAGTWQITAIPELESPVGPIEVEIHAGRVTEIILEVERGRDFQGRVVDEESGQGIAGARVYTRWKSTTAGPDGAFLLRGVDMSGYGVLRFRAEGYCESALTASTVPVDEPLVVALHKGNQVSGRVLTAKDSRPLENVQVAVRSRLGRFGNQRVDTWISTRTLADGSFRLEGLPLADEAWLIASQPGLGVRTIALGRLPKDPGETNVGDVLLWEGSVLLGHCTDESGSPVVGARISLVPEAKGWRVGKQEPRSDASGRFLVGELVAGVYSLRVDHDAVRVYEELIEIAAGEELRVDVICRTPPQIRGLVLDSAGQPVSDITVRAVAPSAAPGHRTNTNVVGEFAVKLETAGPVLLFVVRQEPQGKNIAFATDVSPGGPRALLQFAELMPLEGRVSLPDGSPAHGARVSAKILDKLLLGSTTTDAEGRFAMFAPRDLQVWLSATTEGMKTNRAVSARSGDEVYLTVLPR